MPSRKQPGFALAELMLTLGTGAVLLTIAWPQHSGGPQQSGAPIASNERAVIASLRAIASAQAELAASGAIDTDDDGVGEYGYFGELMGSAPLRVYDADCDCPGLEPDGHLTPPLLPPDFGNFLFDATIETVLQRDGYYFKLFLPDYQNARDVPGIAEDGPPGIGGSDGVLFPAPDEGETLWCCYAWPVENQVTGRRAFFVNQEGRFLQTRNDGHFPGSLVYEGRVSVPAFDAAYSNRPAAPNGLTGMGAPLGSPPMRANDGNRWTAAGR